MRQDVLQGDAIGEESRTISCRQGEIKDIRGYWLKIIGNALINM